MEFDEHDEQEEEVGIQLPPGTFDPIGKRKTCGAYRYRECLKNHALGIGGHALDGCGEFMAVGDDGTLDALKCAACNCHRNFHRKEINRYQDRIPTGYLHMTPVIPYSHHPRPLALPSSTYREDLEEISNPSSSGGGSGSRKRFRTKFTPEQKDRMLAFSEALGWRIQKHDEAAVMQFCAETGIRRNVLKVWMHNNKHTIERERRV